MKQVLNDLLEYNSLDEAGAYELIMQLVTVPNNEVQIAALLSVFIMREVSLQELLGFRRALMELCLPLQIDGETIDVCGTGGDGKNTFNISTLASFIVAAAGGRVVKHGNYGVSSVSGSSDVMEYLGYHFTNESDILKRQLDQNNICFLHAPLFHPALKQVANVRRQMGIKTFFNMLGPLVNPANPTHRLAGTYSLPLARLYHYLFQQQACKYVVVHSLDGYDEISLTAPCKWYSDKEEGIFKPEEWNMSTLAPQSIAGGNSVKENAEIFIKVLQGNGSGAQTSVVTANAAAALKCIHPNKNIIECLNLAKETLQSGRAFQTFKKTIS